MVPPGSKDRIRFAASELSHLPACSLLLSCAIALSLLRGVILRGKLGEEKRY